MGPESKLPGKFTFYVNGYPAKFYTADQVLDLEQYSVSEVNGSVRCITCTADIVSNNIRSGQWIVTGTLADTEPEISAPNLEDVL